MARTLTFATLAGLASLIAACGGSDDDARGNAPEAEQPAAAASENAFVKPDDPARPVLSGQQIFNAQCSHCHAPGDEGAGTLQLAATRGGDYAVLEQREDLTSDYVKYIVRNGLNGMPPFKPTVITDAELELLAAYLAKMN